jgi:hypothetical protein
MAKQSTSIYWIIILGIILLGFVLFRNPALESFATSTPQCPQGYTFFNDARGESMCCSGKVDPFAHKCLTTGVCAMKKGSGLWCGDLITKQTAEAAKASCPPSMPHYARIGKCCATATDLDGYDCSAADISNTASGFCTVTGSGGIQCAQRKMEDGAFCPTGLTKTSYTMGPKEQSKYGAAAKGKVIPVCFGMEGSCIPDNVIQTVQKEGIYRDKTDLSSWLYACSGWDRVKNKRDLTGKIDSSYV